MFPVSHRDFRFAPAPLAGGTVPGGSGPPPGGGGPVMNVDEVIDRLRELVAMNTAYDRSNQVIAGYLTDALRPLGFACEERRFWDEAHAAWKSLLIATRGDPKEIPLGLVIHTDGVQSGPWREAFELEVKEDGRLIGLGTASNKGAIAVLLDLLGQTDTPVQVFFSFNQEGGLTGVEHLIEACPDYPWPEHLLVYGSTGLAPVAAAKGYGAFHAAFPDPRRLLDFLCKLDDIQRILELEPYRDARFDPPFGTLNAVFPDAGFGFTQVPASAGLTLSPVQPDQSLDLQALVDTALATARDAGESCGAVEVTTRGDAIDLAFATGGGHGSVGCEQSAIRAMSLFWSHFRNAAAAARVPLEAIHPAIGAERLELLIEYRPLPFDKATSVDVRAMVEQALFAVDEGGAAGSVLRHLGHSEGFNTAEDDPLRIALERITGVPARATSLSSEAAPLSAKRPSTMLVGHGGPEQLLHAGGEFTTEEALRGYFSVVAETLRVFSGAERPAVAPSAAVEAVAGLPARPSEERPHMVLVAGADAVVEARRLYGDAPMLVLLAVEGLSVINIVDNLFLREDLSVYADRTVPLVGTAGSLALAQWASLLQAEYGDLVPQLDADARAATEVFPVHAVPEHPLTDDVLGATVQLKAGGGLPEAWLEAPSTGSLRFYLPASTLEPDALLALRRAAVEVVFEPHEWQQYLLARHRMPATLGPPDDAVHYAGAFEVIERLRFGSPATPVGVFMIEADGHTRRTDPQWVVQGPDRFVHASGSTAHVLSGPAECRVVIDMRVPSLSGMCLALDDLCDLLLRRNVVPQSIEWTLHDGEVGPTLALEAFREVLMLHGCLGEMSEPVRSSTDPSRIVFTLKRDFVRDVYGDGRAFNAVAGSQPSWAWEPGIRQPSRWERVDAWGFVDRRARGGGLELVVAEREGDWPAWSAAASSAAAQLASRVRAEAERIRIVTVGGDPPPPSLRSVSTLVNQTTSISGRHAVQLDRLAANIGGDAGLDSALFAPYLVATPSVAHRSRPVVGEKSVPTVGCVIVPTAYDPRLRDTLAHQVLLAREHQAPLLIMASQAATPAAIAAYFQEKGLSQENVYLVYVEEGYQVPGLDLASSAVPIPQWGNDSHVKRMLGQAIALRLGWVGKELAMLLLDDDVTGMAWNQVKWGLQQLSLEGVNVAGWRFDSPGALPDQSVLMHLARLFIEKQPFLGEGAVMARDLVLFLHMFNEGWLSLLSRPDVVDMGEMAQQPEDPITSHVVSEAETFADIVAESYGQWVSRVPPEWLVDPVMWKIAIAQRRGLIDFLDARLSEASDLVLNLYLVARDLHPSKQVRGEALRRHEHRLLIEEKEVLDADFWPQLMADFMRAVLEDLERFPAWVEALRTAEGETEEVLDFRFHTGDGFDRPQAQAA